jgi:hypothetical protein
VTLWEEKEEEGFSHEENEETKVLKGFRPLCAPSRSLWLCGKKKRKKIFTRRKRRDKGSQRI